MELPENSIGISDLLAYRDCGRRMSYGMRRHTGIGLQSDDQTPESGSYATDYGSAIHTAIQASEDGYTDELAVELAWREWGNRLDPDDLALLAHDLATYHDRDYPGTRTVASEDDFRVPLFDHDGETIYFRFKLDRLYEVLSSPGSFVHVDYKSSKWAKSEQQVREDLQMWAYNFGIHEVWPECDNLLQLYDQLRYGQVPTRKTAEQRDRMRSWLIMQTKAVLADEAWQPDDLLGARKNEWCPWCPIMESCPVVTQLTDFALTEIEALAPRQPKLKADGTPGKRLEDVPLDSNRLDEYAAALKEASLARKVLERFEDRVKELIKNLGAPERARLGYELRGRSNSVFPPLAAQRMHEQVGPQFYELVKVTKTRLEEVLADRPELLAWALEQADEVAGPESLVALR